MDVVHQFCQGQEKPGARPKQVVCADKIGPTARCLGRGFRSAGCGQRDGRDLAGKAVLLYEVAGGLRWPEGLPGPLLSLTRRNSHKECRFHLTKGFGYDRIIIS